MGYPSFDVVFLNGTRIFLAVEDNSKEGDSTKLKWLAALDSAYAKACSNRSAYRYINYLFTQC